MVHVHVRVHVLSMYSTCVVASQGVGRFAGLRVGLRVEWVEWVG